MPGISEITPQKGERALIIGGTRSGKSTLMDHFMREIVRQRPKAQVLLLDTKPRFRTEIERYGPQNRLSRPAAKHYKDWESGPVIPYSVKVDIHRDKPLERYWRDDDKCRIAVAQSELPTERGRLLEIADDWYNIRQRKSDRVLAVDELLDHYHRNSLSIHAARDVPLKVVRAGGERGFGALYGAQRPKRVASPNCRRIVRSLSIPLALSGGHQVSVGHGNAYRNCSTGGIRRRLRFPRNPYPTWRKMRIRPHLSPCPR
jgi:energy-coupling factor transporter ATP-binding protein EcfA2